MMQYPIMVASAVGSTELILLMLKNKFLNIEVKDKSGINAFWVACYFGHGNIMYQLANVGIDVLSTNQMGINALHLAVQKNLIKIVL